MRLSVLFIAVAVLFLAGCAEPAKVDKPRSQMTQRERDSTIAASGLPGSGVVKKGMHIADIEAKRAAMLDSVTSGN
jgi:hypothetical protein